MCVQMWRSNEDYPFATVRLEQMSLCAFFTALLQLLQGKVKSNMSMTTGCYNYNACE